MMKLFPYLSKHPIPLRILAGPFKGTRLILNPACSKRKVFGIYEHVLNPWLKQILPDIEVLWDVGANDGYFTYGCANAIAQHHRAGHVISFEPELAAQPGLQQPATWPQYADIQFEFIPLFVGSTLAPSTITLEAAYRERPSLHEKTALIKVDVEGSEVDVLKSAASLLQAPNHWVVEVHGDPLLDPVLNCFAAANRAVDVHPPEPHWLFGPEARTIKTSWVTTRP